MKNLTQPHLRGCQAARRSPRGFTLVELLVVISIIAILAALLLPVIARVKIKAQIAKAKVEASSIAAAIHSYEADYSKFPAGSDVANAASAVPPALGGAEDFTFGTKGVICVGPGGPNAMNAGFSTPTGLQPVETPSTGATQTNNSQVMAVLMDKEYWSGQPTVNQGHVKNPQKNSYLNATMAADNKSPGIGQDGIYRDLWGNPYIITIDLNYDDKARDAFYRLPAVSEDPSDATKGLNGLHLRVKANGTAEQINGQHVFEANSPVMIWSAGPDKMIDPNTANAPNGKANQGANKDNILSWKQ